VLLLFYAASLCVLGSLLLGRLLSCALPAAAAAAIVVVVEWLLLCQFLELYSYV